MPLAPGTQVWVRCDDGEWWPAKTRLVTPDLHPFMEEAEDCCVEFYHDVGQLYPINSTDAHTVQPLHRQEAARSHEEESRFSNETTHAAVERAMRDSDVAPPPHPSATESVGSEANGAIPPLAAPSPDATPFTADELRNIRLLLGAVSGTAASQLLQGLSRSGVDLSPSSVQRYKGRDRAGRKRDRAESRAQPYGTSSVTSILAEAPRTTRTPIVRASPARPERRQRRRRVRSPGEGNPWSSSSSSLESEQGGGGHGGDEAVGSAGGQDDGSSQLGDFVEPVGPDILDVLRAEVFENQDVFALSPIYRFIDILGALVVENASVRTTLPSPQAVRHVPESGFDARRRVLLVALAEDYSHTSGWMQPVKVDDTLLAMHLAVNEEAVPVPANWALTPGKEETAIRTAPVADVTARVMATGEDLFSLAVGFTEIPEDTDLWRGIVVCIFAEEVPIATVGEQIVANYRKSGQRPLSRTQPSSRRSASREDGTVNVTEGYVRLQCPLTTMPMEIPVRGVTCEHLQCMELAALLIHCVRSNLWNCPLCAASVKPRDVWVNYRLKDWIQTHHTELPRVEFVLETAPGTQLKAQYKDSRTAQARDVEEVDDD